jgi:hypothetical protein
MWFRGLTLLPCLVLLGACGTVDEMPPQTAASHQEPQEFPEFYSAEPPARDPEVPPPAPRLLHSKTLGESYDTPVMSPAGQMALYGGRTVVVNNVQGGAYPGSPAPCYCGGGSYYSGSYYGGPYYGVSRGVPYTSTHPGAAGGGEGSGGHVPGHVTTGRGAPSTPSVGGNWPTIPSQGPKTNR